MPLDGRILYRGKIDIVYQRLKEGSLVVTKKGDVYSVRYGKLKRLTISYDNHHEGSKRYCFVTIYKQRIHHKNGERIIKNYRRKIAVHKLVWIAFNGAIPKNHRIHHYDHNSQHNHLSNLRCWHKDKHIAYHNNGESDEQSTGVYDSVW